MVKKSILLKRRKRPRPMLFIFLGFLATILLGTFLLSTPIANTDGHWLGFTDSLFTATSAVCVTGLVVRSTSIDFAPFGQAVLLVLIQVGGLGVMTLATLIFIVIGKRITLRDRVALQEALGQDHIKGVVKLVRNIVIMTAIIEASGALLLLPFFCVKNGAIGIWQAIFISVSAFCNAGFDILGTTENPYASLTAYNGNAGILLIVSALIVLGGLGFAVINDVIVNKFRFRRYRIHTKIVLVISLILLLFGAFSFLWSEFESKAFEGMNGGQKLLNAIFQSVTARTAGFNAVEQSDLSSTGFIITCFLMFVGASPGGTGGGVKTTTLAVIVMMAVSGFRGKSDVVLGKQSISAKSGYRAVAVLILAATLISASTIIILASNDVLMPFALFDAISAFSTVGLSTGICQTLSPVALYTLIIVMFIGRFGPLSIGLMFPKNNQSDLKFPNAGIMIG